MRVTSEQYIPKFYDAVQPGDSCIYIDQNQNDKAVLTTPVSAEGDTAEILTDGANRERAAPAVLRKTSESDASFWVLYGSHTGNCERLAHVTGQRLSRLGMAVVIQDMGSFEVNEFGQISHLLLIVSTHGVGEPPAQAAEFYDFLHSHLAPKLPQLHYSVLALGDTGYVAFCQTGIDMDMALEKLGAKRMLPRVDCDVDFEDDYNQWFDAVIAYLRR
jgi:sulfite reductase alpha subunit-like flavoprotein